MSTTRFYDDDARVKKKLDESLRVGMYHMDVPGNGMKPTFMEDPQIRLQKWGANMRTNTIQIDEDLRGLNRKVTRDIKQYDKEAAYSASIGYDSASPIIDESRATLPAWTFRDKERDRWDYSNHDSQQYIQMPFEKNESSRITVKDQYKNNIK